MAKDIKKPEVLKKHPRKKPITKSNPKRDYEKTTQTMKTSYFNATLIQFLKTNSLCNNTSFYSIMFKTIDQKSNFGYEHTI